MSDDVYQRAIKFDFLNTGLFWDQGSTQNFQRLNRITAGDFEHAARQGLFFDLLRGSLSDDVPALDECQAIAVLGLVHVMGGDEHGHAVGSKAVQQIPEGAPRKRVNAGGGFVQKENLGAVDDGGAQGQPLAPPAGQVARFGIFETFQIRQFDGFGDAFLQVLLRNAIGGCVEIQVLQNGQIVVQAEALRHVANLRADLPGLFRHGQPHNAGRTGSRFDQPQQHANGGGLAGAVWPEKPEYLAVSDLEIDLVHGGEIAKALGQVFDLIAGIAFPRDFFIGALSQSNARRTKNQENVPMANPNPSKASKCGHNTPIPAFFNKMPRRMVSQ